MDQVQGIVRGSKLWRRWDILGWFGLFEFKKDFQSSLQMENDINWTIISRDSTQVAILI